MAGKSFGTLEKAVDILCLFDSRHQELSAQEIAQRLGMPLSTAYKYLQVFHNKRFLSRDDHSNKYFLGLTILKLGLLATEKLSMLEIAAPYLKTLADRSLETALLTILDGMHVVCVDVIESPRAIKFITGRGSVMPLYAGSPGKAVLAFKDSSFIDEVITSTGLARLNRNTITGGDQLKSELSKIKIKGYSESDSEIESDVCSLAAPIFDYKNQVIGSIVVAGPADRIFKDNKYTLIDLVKQCAKNISSEIGHSRSQAHTD